MPRDILANLAGLQAQLNSVSSCCSANFVQSVHLSFKNLVSVVVGSMFSKIRIIQEEVYVKHVSKREDQGQIFGVKYVLTFLCTMKTAHA